MSPRQNPDDLKVCWGLLDLFLSLASLLGRLTKHISDSIKLRGSRPGIPAAQEKSLTANFGPPPPITGDTQKA